MNLRFIKSPEKRIITEQLNEQFGIENLPYLLLESGKEKIRAFSGHLSKEEISKISQILNIESIGIYLLRKETHSELRLSFDATHILKNQIKNNIIDINKAQLIEWIRGRDVSINTDKGIKVIKYNSDFLGCGKSSGDRIINHVPKDRRIKK
ncbi:hypothetical protein HYW75_07045 [Candidatus Pacearchaeota archaeon]|nr:hypothetical protein [Candidatus Pacearchaeota archaeon]